MSDIQIQKKKNFNARVENQKQQLEKHGNFAEVVVRTTPESTDMINFARLWEYVLVQADRQSRGYMAKDKREEFDKTRKSFEDSLAFMIDKLKEGVERHNIDLKGKNFISRIAQRYGIAEKSKAEVSENAQAAANPLTKKVDEKIEKPSDEVVVKTAKAEIKGEAIETPVEKSNVTENVTTRKKIVEGL